MVKLYTLGTCSGVPTLERNVTCNALKLDSGNYWLIDCGEASQHQILKMRDHGFSFNKITKILITHLHGDHCFGVPGLLAMCSMRGCDHEIEVIGPPGIKKYLETAFEISSMYISFKLQITELSANTINHLGLKDELIISAHPLTHRVTCFGYEFTEPDTEGFFDGSKAVQLGILVEKISESADGSMILDNGIRVTVKECIGAPIPGRKFVILGDTANSDNLIEAITGCDLLVHECTFDSTMYDRALASGHSTSTMVGQFANKVKPKTLIITHFSQRYISTDHHPNVEDLLEEVKKECPGVTVLAATDLMGLKVPETHPKPKHKTMKKPPKSVQNNNNADLQDF